MSKCGEPLTQLEPIFIISPISEVTDQGVSWSQYQVEEVSPIRDLRRLLRKGNDTYPFSINHGESKIEIRKQQADLLSIVNIKGEKVLWKAQVPTTIPTQEAKEIIFDPEADIRRLRGILRVDFSHS